MTSIPRGWPTDHLLEISGNIVPLFQCSADESFRCADSLPSLANIFCLPTSTATDTPSATARRQVHKHTNVINTVHGACHSSWHSKELIYNIFQQQPRCRIAPKPANIAFSAIVELAANAYVWRKLQRLPKLRSLARRRICFALRAKGPICCQRADHGDPIHSF